MSAEEISFAVPDIDDADVAAVVRVLRSGWLTTGEECAALERELALVSESRSCVAMTSCTAALETCFAYLRLPPGARVGVPTWTFPASALAPARFGAVPVLLDVDGATLNLDPGSLDAALRNGLDAVVVVHIGGVPVDEVIYELCDKNGVPVVEDAAHALGASDSRGPIGGHGTLGACFSFYANKNVTSGEGGALATDDLDLAEFALSYRLHGLNQAPWARNRPDGEAGFELREPGIKANLPDVLAALARSQLHRLGEMQARRRDLVVCYREHLADMRGVDVIPTEAVDGSADHLMIVTLPEGVDRDAVIQGLAAQRIGSSIHYQPLHRFQWFRENAIVGPTGLARADELAGRVLSLPLHPGLEKTHIDDICAALAAAVNT